MGRKKYYCDYCMKSFNDDLKARSLHINGLQHQQMKAEYYRQFKDPEVLLAEESAKEPCIKHLQFNSCKFGAFCHFSHFSAYEMEQLRHQVEMKKMPKKMPIYSDWVDETKVVDPCASSVLSHTVPVPPESLPISIRPYDVRQALDVGLEEWG